MAVTKKTTNNKAKAPAKKTIASAPKKAATKVASKTASKESKVTKNVAKNTTTKSSKQPIAKKAIAKPVAKKAAAKPVAKKVAAKPVAKKAAVKPVAKKSVTKPVSKKSAAKSTVKKASPAKVAKKVVVKAPVKKVAVKPTPKKSTPKITKSVEAKKVVKKTKEEKVIPTKVAKASKSIVNKVVKEKVVTKDSSKPELKKIKHEEVLQRAKNVSSKQPLTPSPAPTVRTSREDKKETVIVAHRKLQNDNKSNIDKPKVNFNEFNRSLLDNTVSNDTLSTSKRYTDEELNEFKDIINKRLDNARQELAYLQGLIMRKDDAGSEDTDNRLNAEDGSGAMDRETVSQLAARQIQFISNLEKALIRIENKTYGVCRITGKLIDKARLKAVPHATLSIEAKNTMKR